MYFSLKETRVSRTILCASLDSYPFTIYFLCTVLCRIRTFQSSFKRVMCLWTLYMRRIYNNIMYRQLAGDRVRDTTATAAAAVGNPRFSMMDYCRLAHIIDETKLHNTFMSYVFRFRKVYLNMLHVDLQTYPRDDIVHILIYNIIIWGSVGAISIDLARVQ